MERKFLLPAFPRVHIKRSVPRFWSSGVGMLEQVAEVVLPPKVALVEMGNRCSFEALDTISISGLDGEFRALESAYINKLEQGRRNYRLPVRRCIRCNLQHR